MTSRHIKLPTRDLESSWRDLELSIESYIKIKFARSGDDDPQTYEELLEATERHLWIANGGSTRLSISMNNMEQPLSGVDKMKLKSWIQGYAVC